MKLLIIEDEEELLTAVSKYLSGLGYACEYAKTFRDAEDKISSRGYDLILLDVMLPDGSGLDLISCIKQFNQQAGVIIVSAKNSLDDKIDGLDLGADDYITKPFQLSELNSRIKAVLRRRNFNGSDKIIFNEITVDPNSYEVFVNEKPLNLTKKEFELLQYFLINKNRVLTKEAIAEYLWSENVSLCDNFDFIYTHLNNLRKKIKKAGGANYIITIYGMGYKFSG